MHTWQRIASLLPLVLTQGILAQSPLVVFQNGQVADANAVNDNFKQLQLQTIRMQRPAFRSVGARTIGIPASPTRPGSVAIGETPLYFTQQIVVDLDTTGLGGLDIGTVQPRTLYYTYVGFGASGPPSVSATVSLNPPTQGPAGLGTQWTYLGSFATDNAANLAPFTFSKGRYLNAATSGNISVVTSASIVSIALPVPAHATEVYARFALIGTGGAPPYTFSVGATSSVAEDIIRFESSTSLAFGGSLAAEYVSLPLVEGPLLYVRVSSPGLSGFVEPRGWTEDPTLFK